ncbi:MAG TPA: hypothetical protein ACFYEC_03720 [Candidatus Brocadiaceae bacterium]
MNDIYEDANLHYCVTTMLKGNTSGNRTIDLTPYVDYKIIFRSDAPIKSLLTNMMTLGEFLDKISDSTVYESNRNSKENSPDI